MTHTSWLDQPTSRLMKQDLLVMMQDVRRNAEMTHALHARESARAMAQLDALKGQIEADLNDQKQRKLAAVMTTKEVLSVQTRELEQILYSVDQQLQSPVQCELVRKSGELIKRFNDIRCTPMSELAITNTSADFTTSMVPAFEYGFLKIAGSAVAPVAGGGRGGVLGGIGGGSMHSNMDRSRSTPLLSAPLVVHGMQWQLKAYPRGTQAGEGTHLSIFLVLLSGPPEEAEGGPPPTYEWKVELVRQQWMGRPTQMLQNLRQHEDTFNTTKESCWGYERFYELEQLEPEGFVNVQDQSLTVRFGVRPSSFRHLCAIQQWQIAALERKVGTAEQGQRSRGGSLSGRTSVPTILPASAENFYHHPSSISSGSGGGGGGGSGGSSGSTPGSFMTSPGIVAAVNNGGGGITAVGGGTTSASIGNATMSGDEGSGGNGNPNVVPGGTSGSGSSGGGSGSSIHGLGSDRSSSPSAASTVVTGNSSPSTVISTATTSIPSSNSADANAFELRHGGRGGGGSAAPPNSTAVNSVLNTGGRSNGGSRSNSGTSTPAPTLLSAPVSTSALTAAGVTMLSGNTTPTTSGGGGGGSSSSNVSSSNVRAVLRSPAHNQAESELLHISAHSEFVPVERFGVLPGHVYAGRISPASAIVSRRGFLETALLSTSPPQRQDLIASSSRRGSRTSTQGWTSAPPT